MAADPILCPWEALVDLGRQRGYVTQLEFRKVISAETWDERLEDIAVGLYEQGVRSIGGDEGGNAVPAVGAPPPGPLPPPKALLSDGPASGHQTLKELRERATNKPVMPMS